MANQGTWATAAVTNASKKAKKGNNKLIPWNSGNNKLTPYNPSGNMLPYMNPNAPLEPFDPEKNYRASATPLTPYVLPPHKTFKNHLQEVQQRNSSTSGGRPTRNNRRKKRSMRRSNKRSNKRRHTRSNR